MPAQDIQSCNDMPGDPFLINVPPDAPMARAAFTAARPLLEWLMALDTYRALYRKTQAAPPEPFESRVLRALDISANVSAADLDGIPRSGPVIVAANHPHGLVDGLVLMAALRRIRPDIRVLTNQLLARSPSCASAACSWIHSTDLALKPAVARVFARRTCGCAAAGR